MCAPEFELAIVRFAKVLELRPELRDAVCANDAAIFGESALELAHYF